MNYHLLYISALALAIAAGCSGNNASVESHEEHDHEHEAHNHAEDEHDHHHEEGEEAHAGEVDFSDEMAEAIGLKTVTIQKGEFNDVVKASGRIVAAQGDEVAVVATVSGVARLGKLSFTDGTPVSKGQSLLSIASSGIAEGDVATRTENAYLTAKQEYERMKALVDDKIVSARDFEQARLNYEQARTAWEAIAGKKTEGGVSVTAPIGGYLKNIQVKDGDYVSVGQPLATVSQNNRLTLRAEVSEKYYSVLPSIRSANFRTPYDNNLYELSQLNGRIISYGKASDSESFYVPILFQFDNKGSIIPGSFVEVYLLSSPIGDVISVPNSALIEEQGQFSVYVRAHDDKYKKTAVKLGLNNGRDTQVLSGLKEGDEVVTEGAYQIKLASATSAIPAHTHSH
jgi:RND family efflux transporter MFP subunit